MKLIETNSLNANVTKRVRSMDTAPRTRFSPSYNIVTLLPFSDVDSRGMARPTDRPRPRLTPRRTDGRTDEFDSVTLPVTKLYWTSSSPMAEEAAAAAVSVLADNTCPALSPPRSSFKRFRVSRPKFGTCGRGRERLLFTKNIPRSRRTTITQLREGISRLEACSQDK